MRERWWILEMNSSKKEKEWWKDEREAAKEIGIAESTLRKEMKEGDTTGQ